MIWFIIHYDDLTAVNYGKMKEKENEPTLSHETSTPRATVNLKQIIHIHENKTQKNQHQPKQIDFDKKQKWEWKVKH